MTDAQPLLPPPVHAEKYSASLDHDAHGRFRSSPGRRQCCTGKDGQQQDHTRDPGHGSPHFPYGRCQQAQDDKVGHLYYST